MLLDMEHADSPPSTSSPRIAVVTGATSGLGQAAAIALARLGWTIVVVGRDVPRAEETLSAIRATGAPEPELELADLFSVGDVRALGERLRARHPRVDLLVNNAGGTFSRTETTVDGFERTFALNVVAPFVLTEALLPALAAAGGRVIDVVTGLQPGLKTTVARIAGASAQAGMGAYVQGKLALLALTGEAQARHGGRGVTFVALHPGIIPGTGFGQEMPAWLRSMGPWVARLFRLGTPIDESAVSSTSPVSTAVRSRSGFTPGSRRARYCVSRM